MLLKELLPQANGELSNIDITGITCNSSNILKGCAFVCICGTQFDGHNFAAEAKEKGAAVIIAQEDVGLDNQIIVEDTRAAFANMSAKWFGTPARKMKLIGITGTNGKTSVSYMIKQILEYCGNKVGLIGTIQNMIGDTVYKTNHTTPDAYGLNEMFLKMYEEGCNYVVMEVSSHALDQKRVYEQEFDLGIFTNLTQDHLDYHITMENYALAKSKLFSMCKKSIINFDDAYSKYMINTSNNVIGFSANDNSADYCADNIVFKPDSVSYNVKGKNQMNLSLSTGGKFSVYNSLCAAIAAYELGIEITDIENALNSMSGVKGRAESVKNELGFNVIIDYAHTPDGLNSILKTFAECEKKKLTVLFGCGGDRDKKKRPIMGKIAAELADNIIVTSDNPRSEDPAEIINDILSGISTQKPVTVIENRIDAIRFAIRTAQKGDIIVLAGKGHETYQILKDKTIELDERVIVNETLNEIMGDAK